MDMRALPILAQLKICSNEVLISTNSIHRLLVLHLLRRLLWLTVLQLCFILRLQSILLLKPILANLQGLESLSKHLARREVDLLAHGQICWWLQFSIISWTPLSHCDQVGLISGPLGLIDPWRYQVLDTLAGSEIWRWLFRWNLSIDFVVKELSVSQLYLWKWTLVGTSCLFDSQLFSLLHDVLFSRRIFWHRKPIFPWHQQVLFIHGRRLLFRRFIPFAYFLVRLILPIFAWILNDGHSNWSTSWLLSLQFLCLLRKTYKIASIFQIGNQWDLFLIQKWHQNAMLKIGLHDFLILIDLGKISDQKF